MIVLDRAQKLYRMAQQPGPEGELAQSLLERLIEKHDITESEVKEIADPQWQPQRKQLFVRANLRPHEWRMMEMLRKPCSIKEMEVCFPAIPEEGRKRNSRVRNSLRKLTDLRFAGRVRKGVYVLTQKGKQFLEG